jgi:hypothetical protein
MGVESDRSVYFHPQHLQLGVRLFDRCGYELAGQSGRAGT